MLLTVGWALWHSWKCHCFECWFPASECPISDDFTLIHLLANASWEAADGGWRTWGSATPVGDLDGVLWPWLWSDPTQLLWEFRDWTSEGRIFLCHSGCQVNENKWMLRNLETRIKLYQLFKNMRNYHLFSSNILLICSFLFFTSEDLFTLCES